MSRSPSRRAFLAASSAAAATLASGYFVSTTPAQESTSPNEKLNLASIGATGRAAANISGCATQNIVAIADCDADLLDKGAARFPATRKYRDWRVMLEKEAEQLDGVLVSPPDHSHAPAAAMALRLGKHVYCEKPLTHTVQEARTLAQLAKEKKLVTQMGTQIHAGDNYRRVVELVRAGAIGPIKEAHVWAAASYGGAKLTTGTPAPASLDWDLWLGPAPQIPYSEGVHPFHWRRFWAYGTGGLGDFGCHYMDLAHWALDLRSPTSIEASGPPVDPIACPAWFVVKYQYPARGDLPPVTLHWYDGGQKPELLDRLQHSSGKIAKWNSGQLFVGADGMILSNYGEHLLLPEDKFRDFRRPEPTIPASVGHHNEWLAAIKSGGPTTCNFDYSGALTEAVLLGTISYRAGKKIEWDAANLKITNAPDAQPLVHKEYRKGWTL